ncbi:MAG TPA: purine-nucleoside phosphorylase [Myxococcales bacterium]|nr:purine-nucleoside phosphorylase [Myxococcales bacterium]
MGISSVAAIREAIEVIESHLGDVRAPIGMVLGSGLGGLADQIESARSLSYSKIPHLPLSSVAGHAGCLVWGKWHGRDVIVLSGRVHRYEGHPLDRVVLPIQLLGGLGVQTLIITNAAGAVNADYRPGQAMVIRDHLNFQGGNPLVGYNDDRLGPRFPDMTVAYDKALRELTLAQAKEQGLTVHEGVYASVLGPSYETPAEIGMLRVCGADAVGMSTVPEVIAARHMGMRVLGLRVLTNMGAGIGANELHHDEVKVVAGQATAGMIELIASVVERLDDAHVRDDFRARFHTRMLL